MATVLKSPVTHRVLLDNISWQTYEALLKENAEHRVRMTYDQGSLEIMTLSHRHERRAKLLARLIETLTMGLQIPIHSGKSTTFKEEVKKKGLEPDECYWIQHEPAMRGKDEFDPATDPPPDLAIEIDMIAIVGKLHAFQRQRLALCFKI